MLSEARFDLGFEEIAAASEMVGVRACGELLNIDIVVFGFDSVEEPRAAADDGAGEGDAGDKLVEADAIDLVKRRNESQWR